MKLVAILLVTLAAAVISAPTNDDKETPPAPTASGTALPSPKPLPEELTSDKAASQRNPKFLGLGIGLGGIGFYGGIGGYPYGYGGFYGGYPYYWG